MLTEETFLVWTGGDRKRRVYVKHQRARGQLVKQMGKRIPEKEREEDSLEKHKRVSIQHEMMRKQICLLLLVDKKIWERKRKKTDTFLINSGGKKSFCL